jgi:hypothetical protein
VTTAVTSARGALVEPDDPDVFGAWERAQRILGSGTPPPAELRRAAELTAASIGMRFVYGVVLTDEGHRRYRAGVETGRGTVWVNVEDSWEDAIRELGLAD